MIPDLIFFLRNLASKFQTVFYSFSGPPFPPKNLIQVFPEGASATSVYLQWAEIPVTEQGGGLDNYEILYWVVGPPGQFNKVYLPIGQPASTEGFIRYEIQHLQTSLECCLWEESILHKCSRSELLFYRNLCHTFRWTYVLKLFFKSCEGSLVLRAIFELIIDALKNQDV